MVRRRRRVDRLGERLVGAAARIGPRLEQVVEALVAQALDLARRERRPVERPRPAAPAPARDASAGTSTPTPTSRPSPPRRGARRPGARTPRPARPRRSARCPRSAPAPRGPSRRPLRRLVDGAPPRTSDAADERPARAGRRCELDAVGEARRARRGKSYGRGVPAPGRVGDDAARRGHAATSSPLRRRRRRARVAAGLGRYVRTTRLSARKTAAAASRICLGRDRRGSAGSSRLISSGSSNSVAYIDSRSARSSTRCERAELVGLDQRACPRQLVVARPAPRPSRSSSSWSAASTLDRDARADRHPAGRDRRAADEAERERAHVLRDPLVADQPPVQPAALAAGEDLAGHLERVERGSPKRGARKPK